jgi:signal transduction histidine kinase
MGVVENQFYVRHVSLEPHLAQGMVKTPLDKNQIEQMLINLLLNALQAVEDHGRVSVKSMLDSEKNRIEIEIADNGCGISAENVKKIFEPFYTTRANGTGLGLAVSYGIIENHRGNIQVFSKLGEGTRFVIDFPILDEKPGGKEGA